MRKENSGGSLRGGKGRTYQQGFSLEASEGCEVGLPESKVTIDGKGGEGKDIQKLRYLSICLGPWSES